MGKKRASVKAGGFEDDPDRIMEGLVPPGPAPQPDDPATALQSIGEWNDAWVSIVETQGTKRLALSKALREFIEETKYLARWCESVGLDSSPLLEYANTARDTYYAFQQTLPRRPDALWVLLERLKFKLQPFHPRPIPEQTSATDEEHRKPIPPDEANILVRNYLEQHPGAKARDVAEGVGIALGRVSEQPSWRAEQGRRKANKTQSTKRERRLTKQMLDTIERTNDPALRVEAEEAAWQRLLEDAEPRERAELHAMSTERRANLIQLALEQYKENLEESDDDGS